MLKKPAREARAAVRLKKVRREVAIQWDETIVNGSRKKSRLVKNARPKRDQIWVGGGVVEDRPDLFYLQVLEHPESAFDGKPRGKAEMTKCLEDLGLEKGDILVSDAWKATTAAVKEIQRKLGWTDRDLVHEICNHSKGEIVNANGFSSNQIESRWSVLKRWIRKRNGGKLPRRKDRQGWKSLLGEFKLRKFFQYQHGYEASETRYFLLPFLRAIAR